MRFGPIAAAFILLSAIASPRALAGPVLLFDPQDGAVLYADDLDNQWHPASLTKIMTAYLTFEAIREGKLKLDQKISCSEHAHVQPPSKLGLPVGAEITVEQALKVLIVKSGNDVAVMLAEAVAGTEAQFVAKMNATAQRLGMTRTTFVNANGLPAPQQVTTARDLAKLARTVLKDFPEYVSYWSLPDVRVGKIKLGSHNGLLRTFEGADGMKTGFICDSGFNLVASATRDGHRLMAVVLGEATGSERTVRAASLLEHGFQQYGWKKLFETANIDTTPIAPDAKGITSMRQSVVSWECGTGRRPAKARKSKGKKGGKKKKSESAESAASIAGAAADASEPPARQGPDKSGAKALKGTVAPAGSTPGMDAQAGATEASPAPTAGN